DFRSTRNPPAWSPCSCVMTTPSSRVTSSPTSARRLTVSFALRPASTSTRVCPAQMSTAFPVEPLPNTVSLMAETMSDECGVMNEKTQAALYSSLITPHSSLPSYFQSRAVNLEAVEVAESAEGERVGAEELGGDAQQIFGRDPLDARDDLVGRDAATVYDLLSGESARARARRFKPQKD